MPVRVGFLGAGLIASFHAHSLRGGGADVIWSGVYDPDTERAQRFGSSTTAPVCSDPEAVVEGADAVYVCTWTSEHPALVAAAVRRGRAVFCEKPLAVDAATARAMCEAVRAAGVTNQVGLVLRASPAFAWMAHLIADPSSGRPMSVVFRDDQYIPIQGMYGSTWRADRLKCGSGTLLEHSIHDVDMVEFLVGPMVSVSGRTAAFHGLAGIEDAVAASFTLAGGGVGSLVSVWHDILGRPSLRRVEVFCERLWCSLDGSDWLGPVRWMGDDDVEHSLEGSELVDRVRALGLVTPNPDVAFIEAVDAGTAASPDFAVALRAHQVVDAMYRSAANGGTASDV